MRLNNKGFAISGILYSMFILVITLMFLVLSILAGRRTTLNKISNEATDSIESRKVSKVSCSSITWSESEIYYFATNGGGGGPGGGPKGAGGANEGKKDVKVKLEGGTYYLIQAWGGSGAKSNTSEGGNGAYASTIYYSEDDIDIYLNIGNGGDNILNKGDKESFNGGGKGSGMSGSGGGATSVSTKKGLLKDLKDHQDKIILVAAGGGGAGVGAGGAGGGLYNGLDGSGSGNGAGMGATSSSGGTGGSDTEDEKSGKNGSFGKGGNAGHGDHNSTEGGGGGGGYYGGGGAASSTTNNGGGGGGISYINNDFLELTSAILKNGTFFKNNSTFKLYIGVGIDGNSTMPDTHESTTDSILNQTKEGHIGAGMVRITPMVCSE